MNYCPHILQLKSSTTAKDEYGRPVKGSDTWTDVCKCRCDDNTTKEFHSENGNVFRPSFHIVCEGKVSFKEGAEVRCKKGEVIRGSGKVYMVKNLNFLNYSEIWV
jgi:hypothetical protein